MVQVLSIEFIDGDENGDGSIETRHIVNEKQFEELKKIVKNYLTN